MNWTGGSLQRHSKNAHKGVVSRQKQHFAKIRTALQNGSGAAAVPFRPSYLVEDNETLCSQLTPFGRGSVRHTGHSKRLSERRESEGLCLWESQPRKPRDEARQPAEVAAFRGRYQSHPLPHRSGSYGPESTPGDAGAKPKEPARKSVDASDVATEHQLLEANRLRLLNQRDWVGLAAQRPAKIQFASIREKDRIGKRRKIKAQRGQQPRLEEDITWAPRYETHDNLPGRHMSGGLRNDIKDIRIRVGTGALGTETSAPQSDYAAEEQAEANREQLSDPMLFDQEETYTSPQVSRQRPRSVNNHQTASAGQMTRPGPEAYPEFSLSDGDRSHETSKDHTSPHHDGVGLHRNQFGEADAANHNPALLQFAKHGPANAQPHSEASKSNILHIGRGGNNPLRLIVNPSFENASSMGALPDTGAVKDCDVKEGVACRQANAGLPDFGRRQRSDSEQRVSSSTNQRLPRIVDDSRWRPFVDIADISSSRSTAVLSHTRRSPQRSDGNDMLCAWSQQATVGGQTLAKVSSPISASLPLIKYSNEGGTVGHPSGIDQQGEQVASTRQSQHMDESERLWRTFVFADEEGVVSEGQSTRECCTDTQSDSPVISLQPAGTLPSDSTDALLSSMNSMLPTFPNSAASAKLRMTDKARAVERCSTSMARPGSRYPSAGSSIAGRSIEGRTTALSSMQQRHNGVLRSEERRDFGCSEGVSVTQSSLFNDVSHDTFSSGTFGSGLDR